MRAYVQTWESAPFAVSAIKCSFRTVEVPMRKGREDGISMVTHLPLHRLYVLFASRWRRVMRTGSGGMFIPFEGKEFTVIPYV